MEIYRNYNCFSGFNFANRTSMLVNQSLTKIKCPATYVYIYILYCFYIFNLYCVFITIRANICIYFSLLCQLSNLTEFKSRILRPFLPEFSNKDAKSGQLHNINQYNLARVLSAPSHTMQEMCSNVLSCIY